MVAELQSSLGKLILYDPSSSRSTCNIFISRPSPAEEKSLGKLYIVAEIASKEKINIELINTIQETINVSYYATEDLNIETAFEKALEQVNQRIADMVGDYDTNWLDKLNTIVALVKGNTVHFSTIGQIHAFLIRGQKINDIIDSTSQNDSLKQEKINPLKAFSNVISGTLSSGDAMIFCTTSLLDYISQEKLKKTITDYNAEQAAHSLENILLENNTGAAFAALINKFEETVITDKNNSETIVQQQSVVTPIDTTTQSSMENLIQKQADTGSILAPSLSRHIKEIIKSGYYSVSDYIKITLLQRSPRRVKMDHEMKYYRPASKDNLIKKSTPGSFITMVWKGIRNIGGFLIVITKSLFGLIQKRDKIAENIKATPQTLSQKITSLIITVKRLPKISKIILGVAIIAAFFLSQSIYSTAVKNNQAVHVVEYDQTISQISQNILKAGAALSYGNEDGARTLLLDSQTLLNNLKEEAGEEDTKIAELQSDINAQLEKLRHVFVTENPKIITTFTGDEGTIHPATLTLLGSSLFTFDPSLKTIYKSEIGNGAVTSWPQEDADKTLQYAVPISNTKIAYLNTGNNITEFDINNEQLDSFTLAVANEDANIIDIATYEGKLYYLDINNNQIFRSVRSGSSYGTPSPWLKDDSVIRDGKSLAIDGYIYVLASNGTVTRFFQGSRQEWSLSIIDPPLNRADKIWTDTVTDNIYVLDSRGKRIIEYSKEGRLLNQYTSPQITNPKDIAVDYANKKIYVLNDNVVFELNIQ